MRQPLALKTDTRGGRMNNQNRIETGVEQAWEVIARQFEQGADDRGGRLRNVLIGAVAMSAMMLASTSAVLLMAWALR